MSSGGMKVDTLSGDLNLKYIQRSKELYYFLCRKYEVNQKSFSWQALFSLCFSLERKNSISRIDQESIRQVAKKVKENDINEEDCAQLEKLIIFFEKANINKEKVDSELKKQLSLLSVKSSSAIASDQKFSELNEYLHIERKIQLDLEEIIKNKIPTKKKTLTFLLGNVGDGKSHVLSYLKTNYETEFLNYRIQIHNDATESWDPHKTSLDQLEEVMKDFDNENINNNNEVHLIVAINLGILTNFYREMEKKNKFSELRTFIDKSNVLKTSTVVVGNSEEFSLLSFLENRNYKIDETGINSPFYDEVFKKITQENKNNPFYCAFNNDLEAGFETVIHDNYRLLKQPKVQEALKYLLIRTEIEFKEIISIRSLFNFIYDIIVPLNEKSDYQSTLPYLLFESNQKTTILNCISKLDPSTSQTKEIDKLNIEFYNSDDYYALASHKLGNDFEVVNNLFDLLKIKEGENFHKLQVNMFLRVYFIFNFNSDTFQTEQYLSFLKILKNSKESKKDRDFAKIIYESIMNWNGNVIPNYILISRDKKSKQVGIPFRPRVIDNREQDNNVIIDIELNRNKYQIDVDFNTYKMLLRIDSGYFVKDDDIKSMVRFDTVVSEMINSIEAMDETVLIDNQTEKMYKIIDRGYIKEIKEQMYE